METKAIEKTKKEEEISIPPEKSQQIINDLKLFWAWNVISLYKNGISEICKFARHMIKIYHDLFPKNGLKFMINQEKNYPANKEIEFKTSMLKSDLCDFGDTYILVKVDITVKEPNTVKRNKSFVLKNNAPFQLHFKNQWCKLTMQKI